MKFVPCTLSPSPLQSYLDQAFFSRLVQQVMSQANSTILACVSQADQSQIVPSPLVALHSSFLVFSFGLDGNISQKNWIDSKNTAGSPQPASLKHELLTTTALDTKFCRDDMFCCLTGLAKNVYEKGKFIVSSPAHATTHATSNIGMTVEKHVHFSTVRLCWTKYEKLQSYIWHTIIGITPP